MNNQQRRSARLRHAAMGAFAAFAAVGAVAGTTALAAQSNAKPHRHAHHHASAANGSATKTPTSPVSQPAVNPQPFLNAIEQLVDNGTITATQGQAVDRQLRAGFVDTSMLSGFTDAQLQAVQRALANVKSALPRS